MPSFQVGSDGDVDMSVNHPVFEFIKAPRIASWDQSALVKWRRERRHYERKIRERCSVTGEVYENVTVSVIGSVEPRILSDLARYTFEAEVSSLTDRDILGVVQKKCASLLNAHAPDVEDMFKRLLSMDLRERDIVARVMKYFMDFDLIVEENGLSEVLGYEPSSDTVDDMVRKKNRCKLLIDNLVPAMLRTDIKRLVAIQYRQAKTNDVALRKLIVQRATEQQHFHLLQQEKPEGMSKTQASDRKEAKPKPLGSQKSKQSKSPPQSGCLICKAEDEEPSEGIRQSQGGQTATAVGGDTLKINGVLEVGYCADTGATYNIMPSKVLVELIDSDSSLEVADLEKPVEMKVADGHTVSCGKECSVDLQIATGAGPVHIRNVHCLVLDCEDEEFLLGNNTLKAMGIDVGLMIEQLAGTSVDGDAGDDIPQEDDIGADKDDEVHECLERMFREAEVSGFNPVLMPRLRELVMRYRDVWRVRIGPDAAAKVEPLRVTIKDGAITFRCKARKYPELQSEFVRTYVRQLEEYGFVRKNNRSKWCCAIVPVQKHGSRDEFRITNDCRPINRMTIPIAGSTPNLAVVTKKVKGATRFGNFDLFKGFWQMPLAEESQEYFSFMTDDAVYTPTRVPQGAVDSALHFQTQMQVVFGDMLYDSVLIWIDDIALYALYDEAYLAKLAQFFLLLDKHSLKLSATKSSLLLRSISWCGKIIDGNGVKHDPDRILALRSLPLPATAAGLQYLLCATNWVRDSLVVYARVVAALQHLLDLVLADKSSKKRHAESIVIDWDDKSTLSYRALIDLLACSTKLAFPDPTATVCLCTDASNLG